LNSQLEGLHLAEHCWLDDRSADFLELAVRRFGLSARVYDRVRRIARTLADLRESEKVEACDLAEALEYRYLDRELEPEVDRTPLDRAEGSQKSCA
jgi:magnesium chelatase family protein